jgi:hypothetical protein
MPVLQPVMTAVGCPAAADACTTWMCLALTLLPLKVLLLLLVLLQQLLLLLCAWLSCMAIYNNVYIP